MTFRKIYWLLIAAFIITACGTSSSPVIYPTYDPFAPVNGSGPVPQNPNGDLPPPPNSPRGPGPTRAPITVPFVKPSTYLGIMTPTPDFPHSIPSPRSSGQQYTVQSGDTLSIIAQQFSVPLDSLLQANGLNEASIISTGDLLTIPPVDSSSFAGSSFKILPDSELVYGPASVGFDIESFVNQKGGYLASYVGEAQGEMLTGAQIVQRAAENYSVNPRLLLALLEYQSGWVTNPSPSNVDYPMGYYNNYYAGLYRQLAWASDNLSRGYFQWRANALANLPLADGTNVPVDPTINAGTAGVQYFFSLLDDKPAWDADVRESGLIQTYIQLFGYPFDYDIASLIPPNLTQPPMQLPFESGVTWAYTGGPHGGWDAGSAWGGLDFAPPFEGMGCAPSDMWVTAVADGFITRAHNGAVIQDLDNDGYEQTGWTVLYMHIDSNERVQPGTYVYAGDHIGHPSCEGGISNATHLHLSRRYNGEWIAADGNLPFNLSGWISSGNGIYYDGYLSKGGVTLQAEEGVLDGVNLISR